MKAKEIILLGLILLISLFLRLWRLNIPEQMYFDEVYHVPAVQMLAVGDFKTPFEWWHRADWPIYFDWLHPPLAKYIQALTLRFFNFWPEPVAWRLPSVFFGLLALLVFYFLAKELAFALFNNDKINKLIKSKLQREDLAINFASIASALFASDGLFLVQSRLAMNDVFYLFFALGASYFYFLYRRQKNLIVFFFSALMLAFALSTKWSAVWLIILFLIMELRRIIKEKSYQQLAFVLFSLFLTPVVIYLFAYIPYFFSGKSLLDFFQLQGQILNFQLYWASPHPYQSGPLAWIFNWRPIWYFTDLSDSNWRQDIYAQGNPLLFLYFLCLPVFLWKWKTSLKTKTLIKKWQATLFQPTYLRLIIIFLSSFLPWILFARPMFFYHFLPALPYLVLLVTWPVYLFSLTIKSKDHRQALIFHFLFWPLLMTMLFYPHWTALPVPEKAAHSLYFFLSNWR